MKSYLKMSKEELQQEKLKISNEYEKAKQLNLKIDISRGKPSAEQLNLSTAMMEIPFNQLTKTKDGIDARNYGLISGTTEAL